jgi:hypothetical protein
MLWKAEFGPANLLGSVVCHSSSAKKGLPQCVSYVLANIKYVHCTYIFL